MGCAKFDTMRAASRGSIRDKTASNPKSPGASGVILPSAGFDGGCAACLAGRYSFAKAGWRGSSLWCRRVPSMQAGCHQIRRKLFIQFTLQRCQKSRCDAIGARGGGGGLGALGARDTDS